MKEFKALPLLKIVSKPVHVQGLWLLPAHFFQVVVVSVEFLASVRYLNEKVTPFAKEWCFIDLILADNFQVLVLVSKLLLAHEGAADAEMGA